MKKRKPRKVLSVASRSESSLASSYAKSSESPLPGRDIPLPEERLCKKHKRPIIPSRWLNGSRTSGCSKCGREYARSPKARKKRAKRWETAFIACAFHSDRRCNKSCFVFAAKRRCGSCASRNKPSIGGPKRQAQRRHARKRNYKKMTQNRLRGFGRMRGLELFERSTGLILPTHGGSA